MGKEELWVEALLGETYFGACSLHSSLRKNERNVFCASCQIAICQHCLPSHLDHSLLQIRRYVYHDVIRLYDIEKLVNCEHVQSYIVNSAKVVFLNQRPQSRPAKGVGNACETCDRILQEGWRFCSLACKVDAVLKKGGKAGGAKCLKSAVTTPLSSYEEEADEQLSPNCVFPELTSPTVSPSSSVSTADDASLQIVCPSSPQVNKLSKCNSAIFAAANLFKSSHTTHGGNRPSTELSNLAGSLSPCTSNSKNSANSPGTLKWARTLKWPATSKLAKRLPFTPYGKLSITSKSPNGQLSHMSKQCNSLEEGLSHYHYPSPTDDVTKLPLDIAAYAQYEATFPLAKRRKGTPHRSPIC